MIAGVRTKTLKMIPDERGWLMEILRCDDEMFTKFGQVYLTRRCPLSVCDQSEERLTDGFLSLATQGSVVGSPDGTQRLHEWKSKAVYSVITTGEPVDLAQANPLLLRA